MKIFTINKHIELKKDIGKFRLRAYRYNDYRRSTEAYTEVHLWYDNDCEHCHCGWEDRKL